MKNKSDVVVDKRAKQALEVLLKRGNARDFVQARKFAAARRSWRQLDVPVKSHSYANHGALNRMWFRIEAICEEQVGK